MKLSHDPGHAFLGCFGCLAPASVYDTEGAYLFVVPSSGPPVRASPGLVALCVTCAEPFLEDTGGHRLARLPPARSTHCLLCGIPASQVFDNGLGWLPCSGVAAPVAVAVAICECGGRTAGARDFAPGHADYCPVREK